MLTQARYESDGQNFIWPVPFPFDNPSEVSASLIAPTGLERRLARESDYVVSDNCVICVVPKGYAISIWQDSGQDEIPQAASAVKASMAMQAAPFTQAAQAAPVMQTAPVMQSVQAAPVVQAASVMQASAMQVDAPDATASRVSVLEEKLASLVANQEEAKANAVSLARQAEADSHIQALNDLAATHSKAIAELCAKAAGEIARASEQAQSTLAESASALDESASAARLVQTQTEARALEAQELARHAAQALASEKEQALGDMAKARDEAQQSLYATSREASQSISLAETHALTGIAEAYQKASMQAAQAATLSGQAWPTQGNFVIAESLTKGSLLVLPEPLAYYPGRNCLFIAVNGYLLTPGVDYEEVGTSFSNTIRLLRQTYKGDAWSFWIAPSNAAQAANEYAEQAETSALSAKAHADMAQGHAATASQCAANASQSQAEITRTATNARASLTAIGQRQRKESYELWQAARANIRQEAQVSSEAARKLWTDAQIGIVQTRADCQRLAESARDKAQAHADEAASLSNKALALAQMAWRSAYQTAIDSAKPGVASVSCASDLLCVVSGVYVINPHVCARTPFMGVWPVDDIADACWDGFFFMGAPYPDCPTPPPQDLPPYPERPETPPMPMPTKPSQSSWLPCGHSHAQGNAASGSDTQA